MFYFNYLENKVRENLKKTKTTEQLMETTTETMSRTTKKSKSLFFNDYLNNKVFTTPPNTKKPVKNKENKMYKSFYFDFLNNNIYK